jgi:hypothetical protein
MPGSWPYLREPIKKYLMDTFPKDSKILDIGAGEGTYYNLLSDYFTTFDAVEIWEPYIEEYKLKDKYRNVFNVDIMNFEFNENEYDIIIMGDTLEHLSREDGVKLIPYLASRCKELVIIIPFNLPQGEVFGNKYEIHLQPDLSHQVMEEHYSSLKMLEVDNFPGENNKFKCEIPIDVGESHYYLCAYIKNS